MIKLKIVADASLGAPVAVNNNIFFPNQSSIEIFDHPAVKWGFLQNSNRWMIWITDDLSASYDGPDIYKLLTVNNISSFKPSSDEIFRNIKDYLARYVNHHIIIDCIYGMYGSALVVSTGNFPILPLYYLKTCEKHYISWDVESLLKENHHLSLDFQYASRMLDRNTPYSAKTLFNGCYQITANSSITMSSIGVNFTYPERLIDDALCITEYIGEMDFHDECKRILSRLTRYRNIATEVSGGIDSAFILTLLNEFEDSRKKNTLGIILNGEKGLAQKKRRNVLLQHSGADDFNIDIEDFPPSLSIINEIPSLYFGEYYQNAFQTLWDKAVSQGANIIINGQGGDELFRLEHRSPGATFCRTYNETLLSDRAYSASSSVMLFNSPASIISLSSLKNSGSQSRIMARAGMLAAQPLCTPTIIRMAKLFEKKEGYRKAIFRKKIKEMVKIELFPDGYLKEDFSGVMCRYIYQHKRDVLKKMKQSVVADLGLINYRKFTETYESLNLSSEQSVVDDIVVILSLEGMLRTFL